MTIDADTSLPEPSRPKRVDGTEAGEQVVDVPTSDANGGDDPPDEIGFDDDDDESSSGARAFFDWIVVVTVALTVAFLVRGFVLAHYEVEGSSMDSTLTTGDRVFVNKLSYRLHDPNRGDVVVLHQTVAERDLIKRVVGLPGETIEMADCEVRITEPGESQPQVLVEPYLDRDVISSTCGGDFGPETIPDGHVFVMGDNRSGSQDSRSPSVGPVAFGDIVGRAFVVFWPQSDWRWL